MTVRRVTLAEILSFYRPAVGGDTWEQAIPDLLADPDDARIVDLLRSELVAHGDFAEPIVVDQQDRDILNGMHRIAAAVLNRQSALDVADTYADLPEKRRVLVVLGAEALSAAVVDRLTKVLWSFPFAGGWTNCDVMFPGDGRVSGWWHCPDGRDRALGDELVIRAAEAGIRLTVESITEVTGADPG
ncbi:hypothetical protein ACWT_4309 [Actinoplanes sp. SE50]|nr:hypothetical protein ACPL_4438 [Actinoplanes sp. SE50/110]ATO83724.1 hypothetical protein ACWT_4309 [Actinoplanes sp. SE50]SLM01132.1 hypothetical protein ACSP50_4365 [Actinoplanes sp. SE50/110]